MAMKRLYCPACEAESVVDITQEEFVCYSCHKTVLTAAALSFTEAKEAEAFQRRAAMLAATPKPQSEEEAECMLKRAFFFCEDKEWDKAYAYAERVLDFNPEAACAYEIQLMCKLRAQTPGDLAYSTMSLADYPAFKKAVRFADSALKKQLESYNNQVEERARKVKAQVQTQAQAKEAAAKREAEEAAKREAEEAARENEKLYVNACNALKMAQNSHQNKENRRELRDYAIKHFSELGNYKDAPKLLQAAESVRLRWL